MKADMQVTRPCIGCNHTRFWLVDIDCMRQALRQEAIASASVWHEFKLGALANEEAEAPLGFHVAVCERCGAATGTVARPERVPARFHACARIVESTQEGGPYR